MHLFTSSGQGASGLIFFICEMGHMMASLGVGSLRIVKRGHGFAPVSNCLFHLSSRFSQSLSLSLPHPQASFIGPETFSAPWAGLGPTVLLVKAALCGITGSLSPLCQAWNTASLFPWL